MDNETLTNRTIIDWVYPQPYRCPDAITEVSKTIIGGNNLFGLKPKKMKVEHKDSRLR